MKSLLIMTGKERSELITRGRRGGRPASRLSKDSLSDLHQKRRKKGEFGVRNLGEGKKKRGDIGSFH